MKKLEAFTAIACLFSFLFIAGAYAQDSQNRMKWEGSGGWGAGTEYNRMYDPNMMENNNGEVVGIEKMTPMKGMYLGVTMEVKTIDEVVTVHLGPVWFIKYQDIMIEKKDKIQVKGSRITFDGKSIIIASEVKKGEDTLKLRDESGFPVWIGWKKP